MPFMDYIKSLKNLKLSIEKNASIDLTQHSQLKFTGPVRQQNVLDLIHAIDGKNDWDEEKKAEAFMTLVLAVSATTSTELKGNILKGLALNNNNIFNTKNIFFVEKLPPANLLKEYPDTYFIDRETFKVYLTPKEFPDKITPQQMAISVDEALFFKIFQTLDARQAEMEEPKREGLPVTPLNQILTNEELKLLWQLVDKDNTIKNKFDLTGNILKGEERITKILINLLTLVQKATGTQIEFAQTKDASQAEKVLEKVTNRLFFASSPDKIIKFENKNINNNFKILVDNLDKEKSNLKVDDLLIFSNAEKLEKKAEERTFPKP